MVAPAAAADASASTSFSTRVIPTSAAARTATNPSIVAATSSTEISFAQMHVQLQRAQQDPNLYRAMFGQVYMVQLRQVGAKEFFNILKRQNHKKGDAQKVSCVCVCLCWSVVFLSFWVRLCIPARLGSNRRCNNVVRICPRRQVSRPGRRGSNDWGQSRLFHSRTTFQSSPGKDASA
jgi:hypothetical protein